MNALQTIEVILGLLLAVVLLSMLAHRIRIPYPILFVLGGLALSLIPGLPHVTLPPDLLFLVFIPPLVYSAAVFFSPEEIRTYLRPLALLSIGLVLLTTAAVTFIAHTVVGLDWAPAAVLGAIVSSTDATAVAAISEQLPLPTGVVTILQGESLFNDATGLVLFRLAVASATASAFSIVALGQGFLIESVGGIATGLVVGWVAIQLRRRVQDPVTEITLSLLIPFTAWIPADQAGFSGVLAVAVAGILVGRTRFVELAPLTRRWGVAFWEVTTFLLEGLLFILVGLQGRTILAQLARPATQLLGYAVAVSLTLIAVRFIGVFIAAYALPAIGQVVEASTRYPPWRQVVAVAWAGMRGGESLAPALALPAASSNGALFPDRALIVFLTFAVILVTLVIEGLSLPSLIHWLGLSNRSKQLEARNQAQSEMARAALAKLDTLAEQAHAPAEVVQSVRSGLEDDIRDSSGKEPQDERARERAGRRLRELVLSAQRDTALQLQQEGRISTDVLQEIERSLDLQELDLKAQPEGFQPEPDGQGMS